MLSVSRTGHPTGIARATAGPAPEGTATTRVRFDHGGPLTEAAGDAVELAHLPDTTGSVLVLHLDAGGEVNGAWGTPLPAGDFAAG